MNIHANAKTCPNSRELLARRVIEERWSHQRAARAAGVSTRTVAKWVARYRRGEPMTDRSSAPRRVPSRTDRARIEAIERLRRLRMTAAEIAEILGMALSTVSRWLKTIGLGKRSRLEPLEPPNRYQRSRPGELIHVDVKKLGRFERAGHRVTGSKRGRRTQTTAAVAAEAWSAGSSATSRSTTPPGLPTSRCSQTSARPQSASCGGRLPGLPSAGSGSSG
jgi:transposase